MKFLIPSIVASIFTLIVCCTTNSRNIISPADFEPVTSSSFAIQDSTFRFYENHCKRLFSLYSGEECHVALLSRGFVYDIRIENGILKFANRKHDEYLWWIEGEGKMEANRLRFDYVVRSPDENT